MSLLRKRERYVQDALVGGEAWHRKSRPKKPEIPAVQIRADARRIKAVGTMII